jgi:hypothetical protein
VWRTPSWNERTLACGKARVFLRWSRIFEKKRNRKGGKEIEKRRKKKRKRITT